MARNLKPITGCTTPNRGLNSLSPSWITNCTDPTTGTTNPSVNSILDNLDKYGQAKSVITVSHSCGSDFVCDGVADQVEIQEAITYANTTKLPVYIINDSNYNFTTGLSLVNITEVQVDFGFSKIFGTGTSFLIEDVSCSVNIFKNARIRNFTDPITAQGAASQYIWFEEVSCAGSGLISRSGSFNYFKDFYLNPGLTFHGIFAETCNNNTYDNFKIYDTQRQTVVFNANGNTHKVINSFMVSKQSTNRVIEIYGANNIFSNNYIGTGTQTGFIPIYTQGFGTVFTGNVIQHSVVTPTACIEVNTSGAGSSITGNAFSGWTSGSFQQVFGATANTGVAGNSV